MLGRGAFLKRFTYLFLFGHAGPSLLHGTFSSCSEQGLLSGPGWISHGGGFLLWSMNSRHTGFSSVALRL